MKKVILKIDGMSCSACQNRVEKYLNKQDGVKASVNLVMQNALIEYDESKLNLKDLDRFIEESGYKSLGIYNPKEEDKEDNSKYYLIALLFLIVLIMYISMSHMIGLKMISFLDMKKYPSNYCISLLLLTLPFIIYGFDIIKSGIIKLIKKSPNMDSLVTIGILSSFIYSFVNVIKIINGSTNLIHNLYFEGICMIIYFVKLGRYIENKSKNKTKSAIKDLVQITPESAILKTNDGEKEITIDEVKKDDILICKAGDKIAVDGIITNGSAHFDESFITGESFPSRKNINDKVIAGTINLDGYIEYKAERIGKDSTISEIVRLISTAINTKSKSNIIADKISGYFVPFIFLISFITFIVYLLLGKSFNESIITFVTILVCACPCALGLATPLAIVTSIGKNAKNQILIKSSEVLENACKVDTIVFDKTGTLTYGNLRISKINNYSNYSDRQIFEIVNALEKNSSHPISSAFKEYNDNKLEISNFKNIAGIGLFANINKNEIYIGNNKLFKKLNIKNDYQLEEDNLIKNANSVIYVIENKKVIALIGVRDILRKNVKEAISKLKKMNKNIIMLSGDNEITASLIAKQANIDNVIANVLPKEKEDVIRKLKNDKHVVMMVGDGINDALSLVYSDVSVSLYSSSDIASSSAEVILMDDNLSKIITLINNSSKTVKIIKQNLFWAFIYNIIMILISIGIFKSYGLTISPSIASIAMTISSLTVVFNSLRLRK